MEDAQVPNVREYTGSKCVHQKDWTKCLPNDCQKASKRFGKGNALDNQGLSQMVETNLVPNRMNLDTYCYCLLDLKILSKHSWEHVRIAFQSIATN